MLEKEASIKPAWLVMKLQRLVIYSPLEQENPVQKPKKLLLLLLGLLLAASAVWAASPLPGPVAAPTPLATLPPSQAPQGGPPLSLTLMLGFTCCALSAVLGIIVLGIILNVEKRKATPDEKPSQGAPPPAS